MVRLWPTRLGAQAGGRPVRPRCQAALASPAVPPSPPPLLVVVLLLALLLLLATPQAAATPDVEPQREDYAGDDAQDENHAVDEAGLADPRAIDDLEAESESVGDGLAEFRAGESIDEEVDVADSQAGADQADSRATGDVAESATEETGEWPVVTIFTGTHASRGSEALDSRTQSASCQAVNAELRNMWTFFNDARKYVTYREALQAALGALSPSDRCAFASTPKGYLYTFPLAMKSTAVCSPLLQRTLSNKKYALSQQSVEAQSRITVNWFLLRPDLVTLERLALEAGVRLRVLVTIGHDIETAAFNQEGCPRFATILADRDVYKQRLLLSAISDLNHQLTKLQSAQVLINKCDDSVEAQQLLNPDSSSRSTFTALSRANFASPLLSCPSPTDEQTAEALRNSHVPSILATDFFDGHTVRKTVFASAENPVPTLVFIAGVEGTGHHLWSSLGRKHTVRPLYEALLQYLCDAPWTNDSLARFGPARKGLVDAMRALHGQTVEQDGSTVFFLNTVFTEQAVNMFSFPWGGPRCYLKKYARITCNIDLLDLARMAEEAGVDFRVVVQRRSLGAAIVSSSINRNFGTLVSQTRMLGVSWSLLRTSLRSLDKAFYASFEYEKMMQEPHDSARALAEHLGLEPDSLLAMHFDKTLTESNELYGHKNIHAWKGKLDRDQFQFLSDLLYLPKDQIQDFEERFEREGFSTQLSRST